MKKIYLAVAATFAIYAAPITLPIANAAIEISQAEQSEQAESRFEKVLTTSEQQFRLLSGKLAKIEDFSINIESYETQATSAEATWNARLTLDNDKTIVIRFNSDIQYGKVQRDADIIASVKTHLVINEELQEELGFSDGGIFKKLSSSADYTFDLLPNNKVREELRIQPLVFTAGGEEIRYDGLNYEYLFEEGDGDDPLAITNGDGKFSSGAFSVATAHAASDDNASEAEDSSEVIFGVAPFEGTIHSDRDSASVALNTSAIHIGIAGENDIDAIDIGAFKFLADNLRFDMVSGFYLGKQSFAAKDVGVQLRNVAVPIVLKQVVLSEDVSKDDDSYHIISDIKMVPESNILESLGIPNVNLETLLVHFDIEKISALNASYGGGLSSFIHSMNNGAKATGFINLETNLGTATTDFQMAISDGKQISESEIEMIRQGSLPSSIFDKEDISVNAKIPRDILDATGLLPVFEAYTRNLFELNGNNYETRLEKKGGTLKINGMVIDSE